MDEQTRSHIEAFSNRILSSIEDIRTDKELFDFTVIVEEQQFKVHKYFLAACSEYFRAMLKHDTIESKNNQVQLHGFTSSAMNDIINFCYTRNIEVNDDNVQEILIGASILQIKELVAICSQFIRDRVDASNCIGVMMVAERCNLTDLFQDTLDYCLDSFDDVVLENEFLTIDEHWLSKIISHNELNNESEESIFESIIRWIEYDLDNRISKLDDLLHHVRFALMSSAQIYDLSNNRYIKDTPARLHLVIQSMAHRLAADNLPLVNENSDRFRTRTPKCKQTRIFAVGGWTNDQEPISKVEKYDPYLDTWSEVNDMTRRRFGAGVAILNGFLYAIGGHDKEAYLKSVERYDIAADIWSDDVSDMMIARSSVGVVSLDGYLYAISGQHQPGALDIVEMYDPRTNTWEQRASLNEKRLGAGATVLDGLIYVVGGAAPPTSALRSVECYDPRTNVWREVAPMNICRKHLGCTSYNGKIYAVGGRGYAVDAGELDSAECYDPRMDRWEMLPRMSKKRDGIGLVSSYDLIYAVGGSSGDERLKLVEAYDPKEQTWKEKTPLLHERLGCGLAVHSAWSRRIPSKQ